MEKVERNILFFEANLGEDASGTPIPLDARSILTTLETLPFNGSGRYHRQQNGNVLCAWGKPRERPPRLVFGRSRRTNLPLLEEGGSLSSLPIPAKAGLSERVHVVFFSDNIVGADYNHYAPRVSRLASYLSQKCGAPPELSFDPLLLGDVGTRLSKLHEVTLFRLKIRRAYLEVVRGADADLGSAFKAALDASDADQVELTLKPRPYSRTGRLSKGLINVVKKLRKREDLTEEVLRFDVGGRDDNGERVTPIDVLTSVISTKRSIVKQDERSRAVDSESAFEAILAAYDELADEIAVADRVSG